MNAFNDYEMRIVKYDMYPESQKPLIYFLGLAGESGELCEKMKKIVRDGGTLERNEAVAKEIGDVLWYITRIASQSGYSIAEIADMNLSKLQSRFDNNKIHGEGDNR